MDIMSENENILLHLRQGLPGYSKTMHKLGEFVLNDPQKVLYLTITELAKREARPAKQVTRLCRNLGCKAIPEFKWHWHWMCKKSARELPEGEIAALTPGRRVCPGPPGYR